MYCQIKMKMNTLKCTVPLTWGCGHVEERTQLFVHYILNSLKKVWGYFCWLKSRPSANLLTNLDLPCQYLRGLWMAHRGFDWKLLMDVENMPVISRPRTYWDSSPRTPIGSGKRQLFLEHWESTINGPVSSIIRNNKIKQPSLPVWSDIESH